MREETKNFLRKGLKHLRGDVTFLGERVNYSDPEECELAVKYLMRELAIERGFPLELIPSEAEAVRGP